MRSKSCAPNVRCCSLICSGLLVAPLTWPSMRCIYVTKSAMLIRHRERNNECECECGRKDHIENGFVYSLGLFRLHACMHTCNIECSEKMRMDFDPTRHFDCKKSYREKKTIRTLPKGMDATKEPVAVL